MVKYRIETRQPGGSHRTQNVTSKHRWRDICEKYERKAIRGAVVRPVDSTTFKFIDADGVTHKVKMLAEA